MAIGVSRTISDLPALTSFVSSDLLLVRRNGVDSRVSGAVLLALIGAGGGGGGGGDLTKVLADTYYYPLDANPSNYITSSALTPYATTASLSSYATTTITNGLGNRITTLEGATGNYALSSALSNYATTASLASYATTTSLNSINTALDGRLDILEGATGTYALSSALSNYATTASLSSYATTASLSSYLTTASASSTYATQATVNNINSALDGRIDTLEAATGNYYLASNPNSYITASALSPYATTASLSSYLTTASAASTYATQTTTNGLDSRLDAIEAAGYITNAALASYTTKTYVDTQDQALSGYLITLIEGASAGVSTLNGSSGVMNLIGAGDVSVSTNGSTITVSGTPPNLSAYATTASLSSYLTTAAAATTYYAQSNPSNFISAAGVPWASPGAIGATTPNTARFTTLSGGSLNVNAPVNKSIIYPGNNYTAKLNVAETTTLNAATNVRAFMSDLLINPTTFNLANQAVAGDFRVATNAGTTGNVDAGVVGLFAEVGHNGVGEAQYMAGMNIDAYNYNNGDIVALDGSYIEISNNGNGSIGDMTAFSLFSSNYGTGHIDGLYNIYIYSPDTDYGGSVDKAYGIVIADHAGVGTSKSVNLESRGANSQNLFLGSVLIGANNYLNFGTGVNGFGTAGYGIRDNAGTLQYKNSGGTWAPFGGSSFDASAPGVIGATTPSDAKFVRVTGTDFVAGSTEYDQTMLFANGGNYEVYAKWALSLVGDEDGVRISAPNATNDVVLRVDGSSSSSQPALSVGGSASNNPLRVWDNGVIQFAGAEKYLNFSLSSGSAGYGIRSNAGVLEFKSESASWVPLSSLATSSSLSSYLTTASAASTYATQASLADYLTTATASSTYATQASLSNYATTSVTNALDGRLDTIEGAGYATTSYVDTRDAAISGHLITLIEGASAGVSTLNGGSGVLTLVGQGNITVNRVGQNIAISGTEPDLSAYATTASLSNYATTASLSSYLTTASAASTYATQASLSSYLTTASASSTYATQASLTSTESALDGRLDTLEGATGSYALTSSLSAYLTTASASSTYATQASLSNYLTTASASSTYATQASLSSYLTTAAASSTYATQANLTATGSNLHSRLAPLEAGTGLYYLKTNPSGFITSAALAPYATTASLSSYLTTAAASSTYATQASLSDYLTTASAASTYATQASLSSYLTTASAASTYATSADLAATGANLQSQINGLAGGGTSAQQKSLSVFLPQSGDTMTLFYTKATTTLNRAASVIKSTGAGVVNWNLKYASSIAAAGTDLISTPVATNSTTTAQINSAFVSTIPADSFVWISVNSISGTIDQFHVTLDYTG